MNLNMDRLADIAFTHECYVRSGLAHEAAIAATAVSEDLTIEATLEAVLQWHALQGASSRGDIMNLLEQVATRVVMAGKAAFSFKDESFVGGGWVVEMPGTARFLPGSLVTEKGMKALNSFVSYNGNLVVQSDYILLASKNPVDRGTDVVVARAMPDMPTALAHASAIGAKYVYEVETGSYIYVTALPPTVTVTTETV